MTAAQVEEVLRVQEAALCEEDRLLFGWIAIERGYISDETLGRFIEHQVEQEHRSR